MKKIIGIFIMIVLIAAVFLPVLESGAIQKINKSYNMLNYEDKKTIIFTNYENDGMLDQNQSYYSGWSWVVLTEGEMLAQSFKPSLNVLTGIELLLIKIGIPYEVKISIRDNLSGADLTSISVLENEIPRIEPKWIEFDFQDIYVEPEQTYYIVWYPVGIDLTNYFGWSYGDFNPYDKGDAYLYLSTSGWEIIEGHPNHPNPDFCFKTYGIHNSPPNKPEIIGPNLVNKSEKYEYKFNAIDPDGDNICYYIEWGDGTVEDWIGPYPSGEEIQLNHTWKAKIKPIYANYEFIIRCKVKDSYDAESDWTAFTVTLPKSKAIGFPLFLQKIFQRFPILKNILNQIIL
jgi:hypothetical protein